jgi:hypothetical protein
MTLEKSTVLNRVESSKTNKRSISNLFYKFHSYSTGLQTLIAFLFVFFLFIITHLLKFPGSVAYLKEVTGGQETFDLLPSFSSAATYERLVAFGELGRSLYMRTMLTVDLAFPASMFIFLYWFSKYAFERSKIRPGFIILVRILPVAYVLLDLVENISIYYLLSNFPGKIEFLGSNIGYLTVGKRVFMMGAIFIPLIFLVVNKIRKSGSLFYNRRNQFSK